MQIYAEAYGKDEAFYRFLRTLQSYGAFIDEGTTLILPADSELLQFLNPGTLEAAPRVEAASPDAGAATPDPAGNP